MSSGAVAVAAANAEIESQTPSFTMRLLRRPLAVICIVYLLAVVVVAIVAPILLPNVPKIGIGDLLHVRAAPSRDHLLGTDSLGRDVLDRLLYGTRTTMVAVAEVVIVGVVLGVPIGLAAGYFGGRLDRFVAWWTDLMFAVPSLIIVLVVVSIFPKNLLAAMVTFGILSAPWLARTVRAVTLPVREELYIAAARVSGLSRPYIIARHVLPRVLGVTVVQIFLFAAGSVGITAGLAFLGVLGDATPTWGGMIQDGISSLQLDPWLIWPPGIAVGLTTLALTLLGDSVRDATAESWTSAPPNRRRAQAHVASGPPLEIASKRSLLSVDHLTVVFPSPNGPVTIVEDVSFQLDEGEALGIVGESGCGKTMTAMAILGLLPGGGQIESGSICYDGTNLAALADDKLHRIRGKEIALISQEPTLSFTPTLRVGWQLAEAVRRHRHVSKAAARDQAIELLRQVRLPEPELVARRYPHELSGGMAQRAAIARALAGEPKLLIADEPTTALDVTIQDEILVLLRDLQKARGMAILLITHDWGVIADFCDRAVVMYAGEVVEHAPILPIFRRPFHPYTRALLSSHPQRALESRVLPSIPGSVPKPGSWPEGCHFAPRCAFATAACTAQPVSLYRPVAGRETRCIHHARLVTGST